MSLRYDKKAVNIIQVHNFLWNFMEQKFEHWEL